MAMFGSLVAGAAIGGGFDRAGVSPNYDSDMSLRGLIVGAAVGIVAAALIDNDT
jgi:hypothetical protein